ncbi:hypothetical protein [Thalassiella azotivora]
MALVAVTSSKGSPGTTAFAVTLAALWPRAAVMADCDPAGGDVALRYRDAQGKPLEVERGLLSLGAAVRRGDHTDLWPHLQTVGGGLDVLAGVRSPDQLVGLGPVWPYLARTLAGDGDHDVVADCGRVVPGSPVQPVLQAADAVVFVVRPRVEQLAHLRERLHSLKEPLGIGRPERMTTGVVVVAPERQRSAAQDVEKLLRSSGLAVPVLGLVAEDAKGVRAVEGQQGRAGRSAYVRSVRGLVPAVQELVVRSARVGA